MKQKRIVIIAHARAGSNLLKDICEHKNTTYFYREIFGGRYLRKYLAGNEHFVNKNMNTIINRMYDPISFINLFYKAQRYPIVGTRLMLAQTPQETLGKIIKRKNICKILLYRKNLLETAVSRMIAGITNQWSLKLWGRRSVPPEKIDINLDKVERHITANYNKIKFCLNFLENIGYRNSMSVTYEDIVGYDLSLDINKINQIRKFVGVPAIERFETHSKKQASEKIYNLISNRKELEEKFGDLYGYLGSREEPLIWKKI